MCVCGVGEMLKISRSYPLSKMELYECWLLSQDENFSARCTSRRFGRFDFTFAIQFKNQQSEVVCFLLYKPITYLILEF